MIRLSRHVYPKAGRKFVRLQRVTKKFSGSETTSPVGECRTVGHSLFNVSAGLIFEIFQSRWLNVIHAIIMSNTPVPTKINGLIVILNVKFSSQLSITH